jgi:hypothetical protein
MTCVCNLFTSAGFAPKFWLAAPFTCIRVDSCHLCACETTCTSGSWGMQRNICSTCGAGPRAEALKELEYPVKLQKLLLTPQREVLVELVITKDRRAAVARSLATVAWPAGL